MSTVDRLLKLTLLYVNDHGVVTCNLNCDDGDFFEALPRRRVTLGEYFDAFAHHLHTHHAKFLATQGIPSRNLPDQNGEHPEQQSKRDQVDAADHAERGEEEAQCGGNQQDQNDERHVDPLDLGRRFAS